MDDMKGKDAGNPGCLLIHGYGGSPFELEGMAGALAGAGFAVNNLCLPGHGEDTANFRATRFPDWLAHAEAAYAAMRARYGRVMLAGFSMGGAVALNIAARNPAAGVAVIAAPVHVMHFLPWPVMNARFMLGSVMLRLRRLWPEPAGQDEPGETSRDIAPWRGYSGPLNFPQLFSMRAGCAQTRGLLPLIDAPVLIMHDVADKLVYVGNAWEIARRVSSASTAVKLTRIRENTTRHHMLPTHRETAAFVNKEIVRFAQCL